MNENEHVLCGLFYHFGPKSAIRAPKIIPKRAVLCAQEIIRGPVEPFCCAQRVGPRWPNPPGPKKVPKKPGKNFLRAQNLPKRPPRGVPQPRREPKSKKKSPQAQEIRFLVSPMCLGDGKWVYQVPESSGSNSDVHKRAKNELNTSETV